MVMRHTLLLYLKMPWFDASARLPFDKLRAGSTGSTHHDIFSIVQNSLPKKIQRKDAPVGRFSHIRIKLLQPVLGPVLLALECLEADETLVGLALEVGTLTQELEEPRFLHLRLEALLQTVVTFFAFAVCVDGHSGGRVWEVWGDCKKIREYTKLLVSSYWLLVSEMPSLSSALN